MSRYEAAAQFEGSKSGTQKDQLAERMAMECEIAHTSCSHSDQEQSGLIHGWRGAAERQNEHTHTRILRQNSCITKHRHDAHTQREAVHSQTVEADERGAEAEGQVGGAAREGERISKHTRDMTLHAVPTE